MANPIPQSLLNEDGGRFRLESGGYLVLEGYPDTDGLPVEPRLANEEGGLILLEGYPGFDGGILIEGTTPEMAASPGGYSDQAKFPFDLAKGATGSPTWRTQVQIDSDAHGLVRNAFWAKAPEAWNVGTGIQEALKQAQEANQDVETVLSRFVSFVRARQGSKEAFRFQIPSDWSTHPNHQTAPDGSNKTHRVRLGPWRNDGTGGGIYQLFKEYRIGNVVRRRAVTHPMLPGDPDRVMAVYVNGNLLTEGTHYQITHDGGVLTVIGGNETLYPHGSVLEAAFTFDTRCRFGVEFDVQAAVLMTRTLAQQVPNIPIVEENEAVWMSDHPQLEGSRKITLGANTPIFWVELDQAHAWHITPTVANTQLLLPSRDGILDGIDTLVIQNGSGSLSMTVLDGNTGATVVTTLAAGQTRRFSLWAEDSAGTASAWKAY